MKLQGIYPPITTPFDHAGNIYTSKVEHNIEKWNRTKLSGYVVMGSTGESVMLTPEEKCTMWELVAKHAASDKLLIAGTGVESVRETVCLTNRAAEMGYKAAMVRTPGVAVIVDGYNVSMLAWPDASAAEQRERLCDALVEFQLRVRCEVTVVFDGAEVPGVRPLRRRGLRIVFSAAGQEADDVVVDEVMFRPDDVPVIVVSSDREVEAGAEVEGAAVLTADEFLHLMRR